MHKQITAVQHACSTWTRTRSQTLPSPLKELIKKQIVTPSIVPSSLSSPLLANSTHRKVKAERVTPETTQH